MGTVSSGFFGSTFPEVVLVLEGAGADPLRRLDITPYVERGAESVTWPQQMGILFRDMLTDGEDAMEVCGEQSTVFAQFVRGDFSGVLAAVKP